MWTRTAGGSKGETVAADRAGGADGPKSGGAAVAGTARTVAADTAASVSGSDSPAKASLARDPTGAWLSARLSKGAASGDSVGTAVAGDLSLTAIATSGGSADPAEGRGVMARGDGAVADTLTGTESLRVARAAGTSASTTSRPTSAGDGPGISKSAGSLGLATAASPTARAAIRPRKSLTARPR
jgi:hypothetical protein